MNKPSFDFSYLLVSEWSWDRAHAEVATLTLDDFDMGSKPTQPIEESIKSADGRDSWSSICRRIADSQNGNPMGSCHPKTLYRIVGVEGWSARSIGLSQLNLQLIPVCEFDVEGNIVPPA